MSIDAAVEALEIPASEINDLRMRYRNEKGARHTPSTINVKAVLMALSIRQRKRPLLCADHHVVNESVPQLMEYFGLKKSTIDDVLAFLTWAGICRTIRQGGGRGKNPTVRFVDFDRYVLGKSKGSAGGIEMSVGEIRFPPGETSQLDGELPNTPLVKPSLKPVCVPSSILNSHETGFELDKIMHAYQPEIDAHADTFCDMDTLPDADFFNREARHQMQFSRTAEETYFQEECSGIVATLADYFANDDLISRGTITKEKSGRSL
jgi:hypothetical protein